MVIQEQRMAAWTRAVVTEMGKMVGTGSYSDIEPPRLPVGCLRGVKDVENGAEVSWPESLEGKGCLPLRRRRQWEGQLQQ